jgi:RIP metalloprotease RseP
MASADFARLTGVVTHGLSEIVLNFSNTVDQISGPVAIVAVGAQVARGDPAGVFQFASIININLAVVNLLPLPALDGGFLALLALEGARGGKKLPVEVEQAIMGSGLLLLIASGVVLLVRDTLNLDAVRTTLAMLQE